jgi:hypothetical protein
MKQINAFRSAAAAPVRWVCFGLAGLLGVLPASSGAEAARSVPKWERFEQALQSTVDYANPAQQASLTATFVSQGGESIKVYGFWDGGRTWRLRFAPNQTGKWTFKTACSDAANQGLNGQSGEFECVAAGGKTSFTKHGPVQVAPDGRYLMHQDGTPFFFLSDTAWNGALLSTREDWSLYTKERTRQKFTAVQWVATQWRAAPTGDLNKQLAYTGPVNRLAINPAFFQRLDEKVEALTQAGLLSVPVMLWAINGGANPTINPGVSLPEDQAVLLARYMVARWGANPVVWILAGDSDYRGDKAERWRKIGRAVFDGIPHAPVTMHPGGMQWVWNEFSDEKWYDIVGYQSGHGDNLEALKWLAEGPLTRDWTRLPHKPFINLEPPYEDHVAYQTKRKITADFTRRAIYWSLLNAPTAGSSYGGHGVWGWDDGTKPPTDHPGTGTPQPWQKALKLPGAEQMKFARDFLTTNDFWRLRPAPMFVVNQPGLQSPGKYISVARTDQKDIMVVYVPEERSVELKLDALPPAPSVGWFNPRTGEGSPAVGVVTETTCQFPTPAEGDWVLLLRTQKEKAGSAEKK